MGEGVDEKPVLVTEAKVRKALPYIQQIGRSMASSHAGLVKLIGPELSRWCKIGGAGEAEADAAERNRILCEVRESVEDLTAVGGRVLSFHPVAFGFASVRGPEEGIVFWRHWEPDALEFVTMEQARRFVDEARREVLYG